MSDTAVTTAPSPLAVDSLEAQVPVERSRPSKGPMVRALEALASLRLTVVLFVLSLLLVFFGTLAQIDSGIWTIVRDYFRSFYVWIPLQLMVKFGQVFFGLPATLTIKGAIPFPGGWTIGTLLLVNLLAAHLVRFKLSWKRSGILLLHAGLILMMVGELITGLYAIEGNMVIETGETTNIVFHNRVAELAVIDPSDEKTDKVTVVPGAMLSKEGTIEHDDLPFSLHVVKWLTNSRLAKPTADSENLATTGFGKDRVAIGLSEVAGVDTKQTVETPSCYIELKDRAGKSLGVYLFSTRLREQVIKVAGKPYEVALRFGQTHKPYSLELLEFRFDRYTGTDTARNFSSRVRLRDEEVGEDREVTIRMNDPLRHRGETFYQADWNKDTERGTVLQVVRNPAWQLPYWSCGIVSLGMLIHFGLALTNFLRRRDNV
jgi:hypothetical protein